MEPNSQRILLGAASASSKYWVALFGDSVNNRGIDLALDSNENIYVSGYSDGIAQNSVQGLAVKLNSSGLIQWSKNINYLTSNYYTYVNGVGVDSSDNIFVCGTRPFSGYNRGWIGKFNGSGTVLLEKNPYINSTNIQPKDVACGSDGFYWCDAAGLFGKYDTAGNVVWKRRANGSIYTRIALDSSNNVYIVGKENSIFTYGGSILMKFNSSGTFQWGRAFGTNSGPDIANGVAVDGSGNVYVTGSSATANQESYDDLYLIKYDSSGTLQWQREMPNNGSNFFRRGKGVCIGSDGFIYVSGFRYDDGTSISSVLLLKYNSSGTLQWKRELSKTNSYGFVDTQNIVANNLDSIYVVASTSQNLGPSSGGNDIAIARLPTDGSLTGVYGDLTYAVSTATEQSGGLSTTTFTNPTYDPSELVEGSETNPILNTSLSYSIENL